MSISGSKCSRSFLVLFNVIFWVTGCVLIGIGICILISTAKAHLFRVVTATYEEKANETLYVARDGLNNISYTLVIIGIFIIVSGFLGCYGLIQDRKCMMAAYFIFLFVLMFAELSMAVVTMTYREHILSGMPDRLTSTVQHLYAKDTALTNSVDYIQFTFNCCGSQSDKDYLTSKWRNATSPSAKNVPLTCCPLLNTMDEGAYMNPEPVDERSCQEGHIAEKLPFKEVRYNKGCFRSLEIWFQKDSSIIIAIGVSMATLQVIGMILSVCLCRSTEDLI